MHRENRRGFRSRREKWGLFAYSCVLNFIIVMRILLQELSLVEHVAWTLAIALPGVIGWWAWERWGRAVFPLPPPDGLQPTE